MRDLKEQLRLSVVVTVYTETTSVIETVDRVMANDSGSIAEIVLVVSPKASPETLRICAELEAKHKIVRVQIQQKVPGVGWALREGMAQARCNYVCIMSGDLETEPEAVERMFQKMKATGADVVIGNRWAKGGGFRNYDPVKYVCNYFFQKIFRILYRTPVHDLTYGFKILTKEVIDSIPWESAFHEIYIETTVKPIRKGYHVEEVPTIWIGRTEGKSVNTFFRNFGYVRLALRVWAGRAALG